MNSNISSEESKPDIKSTSKKTNKIELKQKVNTQAKIGTKTHTKAPIISDDKSKEKEKEIKEIKEESRKPSKAEEKFEFNEETINYFTKDLDAKKILIKHPQNSPFFQKLNDTLLICLLLKLGKFKDYHCNTEKCKVGKLWNGKPIQLILIRINNIHHDLSINNLELICANCYMVKYGLDIFIKKKKEAILLCSFCDFPLVKFKDSRKKKGICLSCENQMSKISFEKQEDKFYNNLKNTYNDNPVLSDDIKNTNYSSEPSKYKSFSTNSCNTNSSKAKSVSIQTPIIELNMSLPDLSYLINDDDENVEHENVNHNNDSEDKKNSEDEDNDDDVDVDDNDDNDDNDDVEYIF